MCSLRPHSSTSLWRGSARTSSSSLASGGTGTRARTRPAGLVPVATLGCYAPGSRGASAPCWLRQLRARSPPARDDGPMQQAVGRFTVGGLLDDLLRTPPSAADADAVADVTSWFTAEA